MGVRVPSEWPGQHGRPFLAREQRTHVVPAQSLVC